MPTLSEWANFYVIVGSSAGALIGLQFVVITLIADAPIEQADAQAQASGAFATPSVVHFGMVLFLSAIISAPWHHLAPAAIFWGLLGLSGLAYSVIVIWRMRRQTVYKPVFEDWLFHALLPLAAYGMLTGSSCVTASHQEAALYVVAAAVLLLLFIGLHNAWDTVIYHTFVRKPKQKQKTGDK